MATLKAGCILVDIINKKVGLIYRNYFKDYSFPKGHLEEGETLEECAIRETAEETKRDCVIISKPIINRYTTTFTKEDCEVYMYVALDIGKSDNDSWDTHDLIWTDFDKVDDTLSYENLRQIWHESLDIINNIPKETIDKIINGERL